MEGEASPGVRTLYWCHVRTNFGLDSVRSLPYVVALSPGLYSFTGGLVCSELAVLPQQQSTAVFHGACRWIWPSGPRRFGMLLFFGLLVDGEWLVVWLTKLRTARRRSCILGVLFLLALSKPVAILSISAYQRFISPHKGWCCAYAALHGGPSCSEYGKEEISRHGVFWACGFLQSTFTIAARRGHSCCRATRDGANGCPAGCCSGLPQPAHQPQSSPPRQPPLSTWSITVTSPNTWTVYDYKAVGEYHKGNQNVLTVTWKSTALSGNVNIDISRANKGANGRGSVERSQQWLRQWTPSGPATAFGRIRVQSVSRPSVAGINSHDFCVYGLYYRG